MGVSTFGDLAFDDDHLLPERRYRLVVTVDSTDVGVLDFGIGRQDAEALYQQGYSAATTFLSSWDWPAYLDRFRRAHRPG